VRPPDALRRRTHSSDRLNSHRLIRHRQDRLVLSGGRCELGSEHTRILRSFFSLNKAIDHWLKVFLIVMVTEDMLNHSVYTRQLFIVCFNHLKKFLNRLHDAVHARQNAVGCCS